MKILIMEDEKLLKPPLPEALVILDVTAPGINSRQVAETVKIWYNELIRKGVPAMTIKYPEEQLNGVCQVYANSDVF